MSLFTVARGVRIFRLNLKRDRSTLNQDVRDQVSELGDVLVGASEHSVYKMVLAMACPGRAFNAK